MLKHIRKAARMLGVDIVPYRSSSWEQKLPSDLNAADREILLRVREFTMTSIERQVSLMEAVRHIVDSGIQGSFVECGVWRGGSSMITALTLLAKGATDRGLYLYDTFEGMTAPTDLDRTTDGTTAQEHFERDADRDGNWCLADLDDVRRNMAATNYPAEQIHYIKGPIEQTIPAQSPPGPIALLRLDTDWYASTRHELEHLFPLLVDGGIMIIDDYGHWEGARKAVEEYFADASTKRFLHRIDYTGRLMVK
jgi:O-methyltransferase